MIRKPSAFTRLVRGITALATVWSLGCCGFEPLMEQLFAGGGRTMACADGDGGSAATTFADAHVQSDGSNVSVVSTAATSGAIAAATTTTSADATCGCTNCVAPSPAAAVVATAASLPARALDAEAASVPSVFRSPLVPPPQRA